MYLNKTGVNKFSREQQSDVYFDKDTTDLLLKGTWEFGNWSWIVKKDWSWTGAM